APAAGRAGPAAGSDRSGLPRRLLHRRPRQPPAASRPPLLWETAATAVGYWAALTAPRQRAWRNSCNAFSYRPSAPAGRSRTDTPGISCRGTWLAVAAVGVLHPG